MYLSIYNYVYNEFNVTYSSQTYNTMYHAEICMYHLPIYNYVYNEFNVTYSSQTYNTMYHAEICMYLSAYI